MVHRKFIIILSIILISITSFYLITITRKNDSNLKLTQSKTTPTSLLEPTIEPLELTEEELERYYAVYKDPFVLHFRKALDSYLEGTNEGINELSIEESTSEDGTIAGLDSFDKEYFKSKFIVFAINDAIMGGKMINIVFQDKPDKLFNAWVYQLAGGSFELRGFWQNNNFTEKDMEEVMSQYKIYLEDKEHAL